MNRITHNFKRLLLVLVLTASAMAPAMAQAVLEVVEGSVQNLCAKSVPGDTYFWKIYRDSTVNFAKAASDVTSAEAEFTAGNQGDCVPVLWKKRGDYFFTVTAFGPNGCMNMKAGKIRVIPPRIISNAGNDTAVGVCVNGKLDGSRSFGEIVRYKWDVIDPGLSLVQPDSAKTGFSMTPGFAGALPADFRIRLTVYDVYNNEDSDTVVIHVEPLPTAAVSGSSVICNGQSSVITVNLTGIAPWNVTYSNGLASFTITGILANSVTIPVKPTLSTTYSVVSVSDATTCSNTSSSTVTVTVNPRPTAAISTPTPNICQGDPAVLTIHVTGTANFSGTLSDGTLFSGAGPDINVTVYPKTTTTYYVLTLQDANCVADPSFDLSGRAIITVNPKPVTSPIRRN